jgi:hypothetical protein
VPDPALTANAGLAAVTELCGAAGRDRGVGCDGRPDQAARTRVRGRRAAGPVYAYSFILTNLDVSSPARAAAAEHWCHHRTTVENLFRDSRPGAALRHLPDTPGQPGVDAGRGARRDHGRWLHQLTALGEDIVHGHGVRGGKAMIATLRWRVIAIPGRLVRHARHLVLRLPPGHSLLPEVLARLRDLPAPA